MPLPKLLSIAIPTYNRANHLNTALARLLPQAEPFAAEIQIVVSDNHSPDATADVVRAMSERHPRIDLRYFRQAENLGLFGNFKKCRELAVGKYFWLLSDNDYVLDHVVENILGLLKKDPAVGEIYLRNRPDADGLSESASPEGRKRAFTFEELILREKRMPTLISANVFLNRQEDDARLFRRYANNGFLGFLLLLNNQKSNDRVRVLTGPIFEAGKAVIQWDMFQSLIEDMSECLAFMKDESILSRDTIHAFVESYLADTVKHYYLMYKRKGMLFGKSYGPVKDIERRISAAYASYPAFEKRIKPLFKIPRIFCGSYMEIARTGRRIAKYRRRLFPSADSSFS